MLAATLGPDSRSWFDCIAAGDEVPRKKPHPAIFLRAAEKLGLPPADCLVVEDAPSGLQAGRAAGCRCLGITTTFDADALLAAGADGTAPDLEHARALLGKMCA